jgi:NADH-quinone oxidoreductase subunit J
MLAEYATTILFILFAGLATGCALSMVAQRNPLYSAISLIGVFISLAALYVMLAAPFIAAVQVIVYAGAIMVLVVFVIMLLNVEEEERKRLRLRYLVPTAVVLAGVLVAEATFIIYAANQSTSAPPARELGASNVGLTSSIGTGLFTQYLLPFEITSILLLMAIVGAMTLARRATIFFRPETRVVPGQQVLTRSTVDPKAVGDATPVVANTTAEAEGILRAHETPGTRDMD